MKTKVRTVADLGVGPRETFADKIRTALHVEALTEKTKIILSIPTAAVTVYVGIGMIRATAVLIAGKPAIPIMFLDWWWIRLFQ